MNLIEALTLLNKGKKIRKKAWEQCVYVWLNKDNQLISNLGQNAYFLFGSDEIKTDNWEEYKEPILDEEEKKYLSAVIKPFRNKVKYIKKLRAYYYGCNDDGENIFIRLCNKDGFENFFSLPWFPKGTMYKGMTINKEYTLEELGL